MAGSATAGCSAAGVIRLWPDDAVTTGLVLGEGIETTLAAALHVEHRGTLLQPAWAAGSANAIAKFPVLGGIEALTTLVDRDVGEHGRRAAEEGARRWRAAGREATLLVPPVKDFNDLVRGLA
jgi:putative DNA primase/helicase